MASKPYTRLKTEADVGWGWVSGTWKALLLNHPATLTVSDSVVSALSAGEVSDAGYARVALTSKTFPTDLDDKRMLCDLQVDFAGPMVSGITVGACVVYKEGVDDNSSWPAFFLDLTDADGPGLGLSIAAGQGIRVTLPADGVGRVQDG